MMRAASAALLALLLVSAGCGVTEFLTAPFTAAKPSGGSGEKASIVEQATSHFWLVWIVGPILLTLFIPQIRQPIAAALSAFFTFWKEFWLRATGFVTKRTDD